LAAAAGASAAEFTPGTMVLGLAAVGSRGAAPASVHVDASSGQQLAPEWPCLAATTWHSQLQNHTFRQRPQRSSLHSRFPQAWHDLKALAGASAAEFTPGTTVLGPAAVGSSGAAPASVPVDAS